MLKLGLFRFRYMLNVGPLWLKSTVLWLPAGVLFMISA